MSDFDFKTTPFPHQLEEFLAHRDDRGRGLLWEMGTGKTKETIDQACHLIEKGEIDCILVVAPDGVHRNWITDELPVHMPDRVLSKMKMFCYHTDKTGTITHRAEAMEAVNHPGPICIAMSYDSVVTDPMYAVDKGSGRRKKVWIGGKAYLWEILRNRKCMYVADEARRIKNPNAQRSKVVLKSSVYAPYRRLLNGTPVPNGPFDLYAQLKFLDEKFWEPHGVSTFATYKTMFGEFKQAEIRGPGGVLRSFQQLTGYRNLDLLQRILGTICSRVTKEEVLNLPPKLYSQRSFEMTAAQARVYNDLKDEYLTYLDSGELIAAPLAITRLLRFQQVTSGFLPVDDEAEPIRDIGAVNPRLDLLDEILEDVPHGAIVWARFNRTVDLIMERMRKAKRVAVRYDGQVSSDDRALAKEAFQKGDAQFFVAKTSSAGEGLTLTKAKTVIYVENTFDLAARQQSEDRPHRIGQDSPVNYIDLQAQGTVDQRIIQSLLKKFDIANQITGDRVKDWLMVA